MRPLTQSEIKAWSKDGKAKKDWVTSSKGFRARVEEVIRLSKAAVTLDPKRRLELGIEVVLRLPMGESPRRQTLLARRVEPISDGGVTDVFSGSDTQELEVRITANTKSGYAFTAVEVADWLAKRVDGFMQFADKLTVTGRMVQDPKLSALKRAVEGVGM